MCSTLRRCQRDAIFYRLRKRASLRCRSRDRLPLRIHNPTRQSTLCQSVHLVGKTQIEVSMSNSRDVRRICGFLSTRQARLHLDRVPDHRDRRGRRWQLDTLLFATLLGVMTGQKSFADVERLTASLSVATRHLLGIRRAVPDTTLRDALSTVEPEALRPILHRTTRSAQRS